MSFLKKIFGKKEPKLDFAKQIQEEIYQCETSIFEYEKDIHKIRGWAIDLIHKTFDVPKELWYEELVSLDKIANLPANKDVNEELKEDTIKIALSYKQQIDLRKLKVEACQNNIRQLRKMVIDEQEIQKELKQENSTDFFLEFHKEKAHNLEGTNISTEYTQAEKINILNEQISEMKEELELKREINKQLQILYKKYGESTDFETTKIYFDELKKLINK